MVAFPALSAMVGVLRVHTFAFLAFVVRNAVGSKLVSRIAKGVFVLLGRVSGTIGTAGMATTVAFLASSLEKRFAFVTSSPHTLTRLLVDKILTTGSAGALENNFFLVPAIVGDNWGVVLVGLDDGGSSLSAGNKFLFGTLGWVSCALGATLVVAADAFVGGTEVGIALVTRAAHSHADGLVHAEDMIINCSGSMPFGGVDFEPILLRQFLCSFLQHLRPGEL